MDSAFIPHSGTSLFLSKLKGYQGNSNKVLVLLMIKGDYGFLVLEEREKEGREKSRV